MSAVQPLLKLSPPIFLGLVCVSAGYGIVTAPVLSIGLLASLFLASIALLSPTPTLSVIAASFAGAAIVTGSSIGGRFSEAGAGAADLTSPKLLPFLVMGLGLPFLLSRARGSFLNLPFNAKMMLLYLGCGLIGSLGSPSPFLAIAAWLQAALPVAAAIVLGRTARFQSRDRAILLSATLVAAAFQVLSALFLSAIGQGTVTLSSNVERLGGAVHPVALSFQGAVLVTWGYHELIRRRDKTSGRLITASCAVGSGATAIVLARGRTGFVAALAMIVVVSLARDRGIARASSTRTRGALGLLVLAAIGAAFFATASLWFERRDPEDLRTLTGRTEIWEDHSQLIKERPLFGWGPGHLGASESAGLARLGVTGLGRNAHNALLQATHDAGIIGATFWLMGLIALGVRLRQTGSTSDERRRPYALAFYVGVVVLSMTEGGPAGFEFGWFLVSALMAETISSQESSGGRAAPRPLQPYARYA
jgi:O-antigen ligase